MFKKGFITALGTALNDSGELYAEGMSAQIKAQKEAGASGVLLMGTMGMQPCIKNSAYDDAVGSAVQAKGDMPMIVGVMDNSIARVLDRIAIAEEYDIQGTVLTPPFYLLTDEAGLYNFYSKAASNCTKPLFMYDHPLFTKHKISYSLVKRIAEIDVVKGIKSADLTLVRKLKRQPVKSDFDVIFSNSDQFDVAYSYGIQNYLDGMFGCVPKTVSRLQSAFEANDIKTAASKLDDILYLRDVMAGCGIWSAFTAAMNLHGFGGLYHPDYENLPSSETVKTVETAMKKIGEID